METDEKKEPIILDEAILPARSKFLNVNEALGLPAGSIRAILTISIVWTFCYLVLTGKPIPDNFDLLTGSVIAFYFGNKFLPKK